MRTRAVAVRANTAESSVAMAKPYGSHCAATRWIRPAPELCRRAPESDPRALGHPRHPSPSHQRRGDHCDEQARDREHAVAREHLLACTGHLRVEIEDVAVVHVRPPFAAASEA